MNLNTVVRMLDDAQQDMVPEDLKAKGWKYQDFNGKFTPKAWDFLRAWIGEGEYQIIIQSSGDGSKGPWVRGQFFISPQGYENLKDRERGLKLKEEMHI